MDFAKVVMSTFCKKNYTINFAFWHCHKFAILCHFCLPCIRECGSTPYVGLRGKGQLNSTNSKHSYHSLKTVQTPTEAKGALEGIADKA